MEKAATATAAAGALSWRPAGVKNLGKTVSCFKQHGQ